MPHIVTAEISASTKNPNAYMATSGPHVEAIDVSSFSFNGLQ
jgi:hypothetical protein